MSIEHAARGLAQAIRETSEFSDLSAAEARLQLDPEAQRLIGELEQNQKDIQQAQAEGQPVSNKIQEIKLVQQRALENLTLQRFFQAQKSFGQVMEKANTVITQELFGSA